MSHIHKTENLFLTKIGDAFTFKNRDLGRPTSEPFLPQFQRVKYFFRTEKNYNNITSVILLCGRFY